MERHCPQCGAKLNTAARQANQQVCAYCSTKLEAPKTSRTLGRKAVPRTGASFNYQNRTTPGTAADSYPINIYQLRRPVPENPIGKSGCMLWVGIFWTSISLFFIFIGGIFTLRSQRAYQLLSTEGQTVDAVITDLRVDSGDDSDTYYVHYQFKASVNGDRRQFEDSTSVPFSLYTNLEEGGQTKVVYAQSNPEISDLEADLSPPNWLTLAIFGGMGLVFTLIGLWIVASAIEGLGQRRQLRTLGRTTEGVVFDRWTESDSDSTSYLIAYAFELDHPSRGRQWFTRAEYNRKAYKALRAGEQVRIRYLPNDPKVCQLLDYRK